MTSARRSTSTSFGRGVVAEPPTFISAVAADKAGRRLVPAASQRGRTSKTYRATSSRLHLRHRRDMGTVTPCFIAVSELIRRAAGRRRAVLTGRPHLYSRRRRLLASASYRRQCRDLTFHGDAPKAGCSCHDGSALTSTPRCRAHAAAARRPRPASCGCRRSRLRSAERDGSRYRATTGQLPVRRAAREKI